MKYLRSKSGDLKKLFGKSIDVSHISEDLALCESREDALEVKEWMEEKDYDVVGLLEDDRVAGIIEKDHLRKGICADFKLDFHPFDLIASTTPLLDVLTILAKQQRIFILDNHQINAIVTRGDLQKPPVRLLIFGLFSLLEMNQLKLIHKLYPKGLWTAQLKPKRLKAAEDLFQDRKERNEAIRLADCLQMSDKRDILLKTDLFFDHIEVSKNSFDRKMKAIERLRDKVAHSQDLLIGTDWESLIGVISDMEMLIEKTESQLK